MRRSALLAFLLLALAPFAAADPHPLAIKALESLDAFERDAWSFTQTTKSKEGTKVERRDASRAEGEQWTLLRIDGRVPTARELEAFRREKADELKERKKRSDDRGDVDRASIRLLEETPQRATFTFRTKVSGGMEARFAEKVVGTLVVNKDGGWAERFELRSSGPMTPIPGVKLSAFRLTLTFQRHAASSDVLPAAIELSMRGRAFLVKSLDEDRSTRYSDFVRVR